MGQPVHPPQPRRLGGSITRRELLAAAAFAVLFLAVFSWAKWYPYWHKLPGLERASSPGASWINGTEARPPAVSLSAGWQFLSDYVLAVWPAIVAGLATGAACQTLVPRRWLLRAFRDDRMRATGRAVLAGLPTMLCTCCSAPVAVGLRRADVPARPALAYWLATPLLNPAVMVFMALALPWPWLALRLGVGAALLWVAVVVAVRRRATVAAGDLHRLGAVDADEPAPPSLGGFVSALGRLGARLVPEYLVLIFALGTLRGAMFPLGHGLVGWGVAGALVLALAGTLVAVPTAGEIGVVAALLAAGLPAWLAATVLVTLPAVSLPSLVMVRNVFSRRVMVVVPATVVAAGLLTSAAALVSGL